MSINFAACSFISSASKPQHFVTDTGKEMAFAGRSNAGKSSVINCLTRQKQLARTSKTPGRTQLINFFQIPQADEIRLVDLPGYGFAKVNMATKMQWHKMIDHYLRHRLSLQGLILIMDCRHPLQPFDLQMLAWAKQASYKLHVLLNKSDKLSRSQASATLAKVRKYEDMDQENISIQLFSAKDRTGLQELEAQLHMWFTTSSAS